MPDKTLPGRPRRLAGVWKPAGGAVLLHVLALGAAVAFTWSTDPGSPGNEAQGAAEAVGFQSTENPPAPAPAVHLATRLPQALITSHADGAVRLPDVSRATSPAVPAPVQTLAADMPQMESLAAHAAPASRKMRKGTVKSAPENQNPGTSGGSTGSPRPAVPQTTAPRVIRSLAPAFPASARRAGTQGTVWVRVSVTATGKATSVSIYRSSGDDALDRAAVNAVRKWTFAPGTATGQAADADAIVKVRFDLQ